MSGAARFIAQNKDAGVSREKCIGEQVIDKFQVIKDHGNVILMTTQALCPHIYLGQSNFGVIVKRFEFYSLINFPSPFG